MSTLTKVLIVLLTVASIFLCGIVVTYVANAENYKEKYNKQQARINSLNEKSKDLAKQVNEQVTAKNILEDKLKGRIEALKSENAEINARLKTAERENANLVQKVNSWASITKDFQATNDDQGSLLEKTLEELNQLQLERVRERKELNEIAVAFDEKMAIIEDLTAGTKRLREEKAELQERLDQLLQPIGKVTAVTAPVTWQRDIAAPAFEGIQDIGLKALVTAVDMKNHLASISLGIADGVREGMKFHVTRGDEFICDILIIDINEEEAVGVIELMQQAPRIGDNASTNL